MLRFWTVLALLGACGPAPELPRTTAWEPARPAPNAGWVDEPDAGADVVDASAGSDTNDADDADDVVEDGSDTPDSPDASFDPCTDGPEEPNDEASSAHRLTVPETLGARVCRGDVDWFVVSVPANTSISIRVEFSHAEGDLDLRVYEEGVPVASSESETDAERWTPPVADAARTYTLEVYGFDGAEADYQITVTSFGAPDFDGFTTGSVAYEDRLFGPDGFTGETRPAPARSVVVQVVRLEDLAVVGAAVTDDEGKFQVAWPGADGVEYRLQALATARVQDLVGRVQERGGAHLVYALGSEPWVGRQEEVHLLASADESIGGAMNIADQLGVGFRFVRAYTDAEGPAMSVRWDRGRAFDCGSCYGGDRISLGGAPDDPDQYDDDIILHELGHWVMHRFSADDNPGGPHRDRRVTPTLAYGEGVAYFLSALWRDDPTVTDNFATGARFIDLEAVTQDMEDRASLRGTADGTVFGNMREEIPAAILWDAYDAASDDEPFDQVEIGVDGHAEILFDLFGAQTPPNVGPRGIDMTDWLSVASCWRPEISVGLLELTEDRDYPFDPEAHVECAMKGSRSAVRTEVKGGTAHIWQLRGLDGVRVDVREDGLWRLQACARLPCRLQTKAQEIIVRVRHEDGTDWASWVAEERVRELLGGRPSGDVRLYRTSGMVAR